MMLKTCHTVHANISVANYVVIVVFCNSALSLRGKPSVLQEILFSFFFLKLSVKSFVAFK